MHALELDVRLPEGPRFKQASGTRDRRLLKELRVMLRALWGMPEHRRIVHDLAAGRRTLWDVHRAYSAGRLAGLAPVSEKEQDPELRPLLDVWRTDLQVSESHRQRLGEAFNGLVHGQPRLSDLPALLEAYRGTCLKDNHPRAFNYGRAGCMALLRDTVGRRSELYAAVADIPKMPERRQGVAPLTVEQARAVRQNLPEHAARIWWAMCCTGMGATEYWGEWEVLADRVRIKGTKRPGRRWGSQGREVPLLTSLVRPEIADETFAKLLRVAGASPYQGRKSFACWMEDCEIPRTRRKLYLGHGARDVTDLYERKDITAFLADDRARLLKVLGVEAGLELSKTMGLFATTTVAARHR